MIAKITGEIDEMRSDSVLLRSGGVSYEVLLPANIRSTLDGKREKDTLSFVIYHYLQVDQSRAVPVLIGFNYRIEKDFFEQFITVSGIGPKAALRALSQPISLIASSIDSGDLAFLRKLPGVGERRAKEIVAKLQGRVGRFGLVQEDAQTSAKIVSSHFMEEALTVLMQLQYRKEEAKQMVEKALHTNSSIDSVEELLNEVYRQKSEK